MRSSIEVWRYSLDEYFTPNSKIASMLPGSVRLILLPSLIIRGVGISPFCAYV